MSHHNIIGNEVGRPFIGGPNTGSINGGRKRSRAWMFILEGLGVASLVMIVIIILTLIGR